MKKHITIIALALISLATVFSGCGKDKDDNNSKQKYNVIYELDNEYTTSNSATDGQVTYTLSPYFKANVTYTDVDGNSVELKDITLPWQKEIIVEAPFNASMQAELTFKEEDLTEKVTVVKAGCIAFKKVEASSFSIDDGHGRIGSVFGKDNFLNHIVNNPNYLKFDFQHSLN